MQLLVALKSFALKSGRVWHSLKKPTMKEFKNVTKISALGIAVLGLLGFVISTIVKFFF